MGRRTESGLFKIINVVGSAILLNMLFLVSCLPIVTMGSAWSGLYTAVRFWIRGDEWFEGYKEGFKSHFLSLNLVYLINFAMDGYLIINTIAMLYYRVDGFVLPLIFTCLVLLLCLAFTGVLVPVRIYIPGTFRQWLLRCSMLVTRKPHYAVLTGVLMLLPFIILYTMIGNVRLTLTLLLILISVYFTVMVFLVSILWKDALIQLLLEAREEDGIEAEKTEESSENEEKPHED